MVEQEPGQGLKETMRMRLILPQGKLTSYCHIFLREARNPSFFIMNVSGFKCLLLIQISFKTFYSPNKNTFGRRIWPTDHQLKISDLVLLNVELETRQVWKGFVSKRK